MAQVVEHKKPGVQTQVPPERERERRKKEEERGRRRKKRKRRRRRKIQLWKECLSAKLLGLKASSFFLPCSEKYFEMHSIYTIECYH
jgi:hypothetical protein